MTYKKEASPNGHTANFMRCLAPDVMPGGLGIRSMDQAGREALQALRRREPADYDAINTLERRKLRGGSMFRKGDILA